MVPNYRIAVAFRKIKSEQILGYPPLVFASRAGYMPLMSSRALCTPNCQSAYNLPHESWLSDSIELASNPI